MPQRYIEKILRARVYDVARETPLDRANRLSARLDNQVFLKREDLQPVFSFKLRGAYNKMVNLSDADKQQGVVAASAGNHAQGVALAAQRLKIQALIVMPKTTPPIKVQSVKSFGAKIILAGDSYDAAYTRAQSIAEEEGLIFIHPFDDAEVLAGQGTIGTELLRQHPAPPEAIFVPVGGGGLIAG
ncbi:MAG: PLP-dependent threonine dehydratase, partial [gamma proteobacterium symbiont of Ctena orbiculata]